MSEVVLPEGWALSKIADISIRGAQRTPEANEYFTYVDIGSIDREIKAILEPQYLLGETAPSRARKVINTGDILVSLTRPNLNAVALVSNKYDNQIASTGFEVIKPTLVDSRYIFALVRSKDFIDAISGKVQGALYPAAKSSDVQDYKFPLPPLAEQKVIADKLDSLLAQVDNIKNRLDALPTIIKRFKQSVLSAAVSGKLTEEWRNGQSNLVPLELIKADLKANRKIAWLNVQEASYARTHNVFNRDEVSKKYSECTDDYNDEFSLTQIHAIPISWLATNLDSVSIAVTGKTPSTTDENNWNGNIPFISPTQIKSDGKIISPERFVSSEGIKKVSLLPKGSVLIVCIGTIGKVGLLNIEAAFNQQINALIPTKSILSKFLFYWAKTLNSWLNKTSNAVVNAAIINKSKLCSAPCPLPSIEEQTEIVRRVEQLFAYADQIEQQVKNAQSRVNNLTQSILAKAFRGELTADWRAANPHLISGENSAQALLAKIKAERDKPQKNKQATSHV